MSDKTKKSEEIAKAIEASEIIKAEIKPEVKVPRKPLAFASASYSDDIDGRYSEYIMKSETADSLSSLVSKTVKDKTSGKAKTATRIGFTESPTITNNYSGLYKYKRNLIPDSLIKDIRVRNLHVAAILRARGNQLSMFARKRPDRFDIGIEIDIKKEFKDAIEPEQMVLIQERINRAYTLLDNCGSNEGVEDLKKMNLSEFIYVQTQNGVGFGRFATEIIYLDEDRTKFHRFRPLDVGTIYPSVRNGEAANPVRQSSIALLQRLNSSRLKDAPIDIKLFMEDKLPWVQVIDGYPRQAFTPKELIVYNLFPSTDIEHDGFPVTPLDTIVDTIFTYQSIETYNKLYFQNGRAAKGFMKLKLEGGADQGVLEGVKQEFNASINNVNNSFRVPFFGLGEKDDMEWVSTQPQRKDGEFQFLFEQVTRNILAAFNMSPEEIPGYGHLARGTNSQSLSESSSEFKLTAARDTGIRPLILKIQDFLNSKLFPLIDPELAQLCFINLAGFDAETKQQESVRIQQDMPIHMTYDEVMEEVDKEIVGDFMGGDIPFNERYLQNASAFISTGQFMGHFLNNPAHLFDSMLDYKRDQFYAQNLQDMAQFNPLALKAHFATRAKQKYEMMMMFLEDFLEEDENNQK